jgi:hypothetical protein
VQKYNPDIVIEDQGRFCELYVFAWHERDGTDCDHRDPDQWSFFLLPERALGEKKSVKVRELESPWLAEKGGRKATWEELPDALMQVATFVRKSM